METAVEAEIASESVTAPVAEVRPRLLDHSAAPFVEKMHAYQQDGVIPFSTPGHKQGAGFDPELAALYGPQALRCDIPVSGGIDDLHWTQGIWRAAERLGADAWGADHSFYLVNGSSAGNQAFMLAMLKPGDEFIVTRTIHKSLLVAMIHTGARPIYVTPRLHPELNVGLGFEAADIAAALDAHPQAKLVAIVSPSYWGIPSDLPAIAQVAHARGVPVYVDEAWGPHFHFHPALPPSAMASGIDGAVTSTHKILGAITQSAVLNVQGDRIDARRVATSVDMSQTTSPAAYILTSIDACRRQMVLHGEELLGRTIELAQDAVRRLNQIPGIDVIDGERVGIPEYDLTRLVIDVAGIGMTGFEVEHELRRRFAISPEMSDLAGIICLVTIGDTQESIDRLVHAFSTLASEHDGSRVSSGGAHLRSSGSVIAPGIQAMTPRDAFYAKARTIPLADAIGEISAELVIPYPPGIPVLAPGDVITAEKLEYLKFGSEQGMYISGAADHQLKTIKVVDDSPRDPWMPRPFYTGIASH